MCLALAEWRLRLVDAAILVEVFGGEVGNRGILLPELLLVLQGVAHLGHGSHINGDAEALSFLIELQKLVAALL